MYWKWKKITISYVAVLRMKKTAVSCTRCLRGTQDSWEFHRLYKSQRTLGNYIGQFGMPLESWELHKTIVYWRNFYKTDVSSTNQSTVQQDWLYLYKMTVFQRSSGNLWVVKDCYELAFIPQAHQDIVSTSDVLVTLFFARSFPKPDQKLYIIWSYLLIMMFHQ